MRMQIVSLFLCLSLGLAAAQAQLKVDFGVTGGAAAVEAGYQAYFATDKSAATFSAQSYAAFGTTVTVQVTFAPGAPAAGMRAIDRGTDDGITDGVNLLRDWVGWDTRQAGGNPMTVTISGLPAGVYQWLSYHHDAHDQTGIFTATVKDATGSTATPGIDISNTTGSTVRTLAAATKFTTKITSNGTDPVSVAIQQTSGGGAVANAISVINGFELTSLETGAAIGPVPAVDATDVPRDGTILSWIANRNAVGHGVYLGTDYDDIDDGTTASAVYKGRQGTNSFSPGRLELGTTYYWRVDEILSDGTIVKGGIWSFTVEPVSIALTAGHIQATASGSNSADEGPEKTVNGSGLSADGKKHSVDTAGMWLSAETDPGTAWIQYDFDRLYKLHQMLVWNHNSEIETLVGLGVRNVTIAYSRDGTDWTTLGATFEIAQAPGTADCVADTTIDFGDVAAKHVKIVIANNWGEYLNQYGLSEVRFMVVPTSARQPVPAAGATGADPRLPLTWRAGREAVTHKVYISTDANEVRNGTALAGTVSGPSFDAGNSLTLGKTYYWKVAEVNDRQTQGVWESDVWSFTVAQYLVIDDFESYTNDSPKRVFQYWIDGAGFSEDEFFPKGNTGNGSGAFVGYDPTQGNIMELVSFHGGVQSVPIVYDSSSVAYSEAERTFTDPQDWTRYSAKALTFWFQGNPTNTATQMYVKVNGRKVAYTGDAENLLSKPWHFWYVPLTDFTGVDLKKVTKLAIGFEGGAGTVFIDDIGLSPLDRQLVTPVAPASTKLVARYSFEGNANDSTGAHNGTLVGAPTFAAGKVSQAIKLDGARDYVHIDGSFDLPVFTAALWFRVDGGTTERDLLSIYDNAGMHGVLLEVRTNGSLRFLHRAPAAGSGGLEANNNGKYDDGVWYHVAIVKSPDTMAIYVNGEFGGSTANTTQLTVPLQEIAMGVLKDDNLTRYLPGAIDEVCLYNRALSPGEIASLAGRTKAFDQP